MWEDISIEAIPTYNLPETAGARHLRGRGHGYILNFDGIRVIGIGRQRRGGTSLLSVK